MESIDHNQWHFIWYFIMWYLASILITTANFHQPYSPFIWWSSLWHPSWGLGASLTCYLCVKHGIIKSPRWRVWKCQHVELVWQSDWRSQWWRLKWWKVYPGIMDYAPPVCTFTYDMWSIYLSWSLFIPWWMRTLMMTCGWLINTDTSTGLGYTA